MSERPARDRRAGRPGTADRGGGAGDVLPRRPGRDLDGARRGAGQPVDEHALRGHAAAGDGGRDGAARSDHGAQRSDSAHRRMRSDGKVANDARSMTGPALLVLEDGRVFRGERYGAAGQSLGEAVFCTGDDRLPGDAHRPQLPRPDRRRDRAADRQHRLERRGRRVGRASRWPATWCATRRGRRRAGAPAGRWTTRWSAQGIVGVAGIDTRALVRHLRERGAMKAGVFSGDALAPDAELVDRVRSGPVDGRRRPLRRGDHTPRVRRPRRRRPGTHPGSGWRRWTSGSSRTPRGCSPRAGVETHVLPAGTPDRADRGAGARTGSSWPTARATRRRRTCPSRSPGRCWSGGSRCSASASATRSSAGRWAAARTSCATATAGINIPVVEHATGKVSITAQNHGFAVEGEAGERFDTPFGPAQITHTCPNDGCVEGLALLGRPGVQRAVPPRGRGRPARRGGPVRPVRRALMENGKAR